MQQFFQQFTAWHFVGLVGLACATYLARTVGRRLARAVVRLISTLEALQTTVHKTEILWERSADVQMFQELERRQKAGA